MPTRLDGFGYERVRLGDVTLNVATGGGGPPVLLLHGFPQTHLAWRAVAPALGEHYRVVCPDLPGYGESVKTGGGAGHERYSKRAVAADMVALMRELGHQRFAVVGHDRGALVAFRAGLDHPDAVDRLAVLGVLPAVDMWASLTGPAGVFAFHLYLLAQPPDLPERLIGSDPDVFFGHFLDAWVTDPSSIPPDVRDAYLAAARRPASIHAICEDYRAEVLVDLGNDQADRDAGRRLSMPVLAIWQDPGDATLPFDPEAVWRSWAPDLRTLVLPGGHFVPEERPVDVTAAVRDLVG